MKVRSERMKYIVSYDGHLDITLLRDIKMYIHLEGLKNTLFYLRGTTSNKKEKKKEERKEGKTKEKEEVYRFICKYLEESFPETKCEKYGNRLYASYEIEIKKLITESIFLLEAGVKKAQKQNSQDNQQELGKKKNERGKKGSLEQFRQWKSGGERRNEKVFEFLKTRLDEILISYKDRGYEICTVGVKSRAGSRLAVGLGEPSIEDTGFHVNFLYGMPELPATCIKGVFHHFCEEFEKMDLDQMERWFGSEKKEGGIIFLDSIPEGCNDYEVIEDDIISNHYKEYYENKNSLPIQQEPNLIKYKSVIIRNMNINFLLKPECKNERSKVKESFRKCLEYCSFGGRGAVGYGYLEERVGRRK